MDDVDFLVPVECFVQKYIAYNLQEYRLYREWPETKSIPYLSRRATDAWEKFIISHAMEGNPLPVEVVDSWADRYGVTGYGGVLHTFRGTAEGAIEKWLKTYRD